MSDLIVRGMGKANVEFGAELVVSIQNGSSHINTLSCEAYHEDTGLKKHVEDKGTRFKLVIERTELQARK